MTHYLRGNGEGLAGLGGSESLPHLPSVRSPTSRNLRSAGTQRPGRWNARALRGPEGKHPLWRRCELVEDPDALSGLSRLRLPPEEG